MNSDKQKMRSEIPASDKWDLDTMYPSESGMSDDIAAGLAGAEELASMKGHIMDSPASLLRALLTYSESMRKIERAYIYSHMKRDEDNSDSHWSELFGRAAAALTAYTSLVSFFRQSTIKAAVSLERTNPRKTELAGPVATIIWVFPTLWVIKPCFSFILCFLLHSLI